MTGRAAVGPSALRIVSLFPALLGTYGDGGNAVVLAQRCRWRGIDVELIEVDAHDTVPQDADVYLLGGGEDGAQAAAADALQVTLADRAPLARAVARGAQLLAVCAGLQLVGNVFCDAAGARTRGLGLIDLTTTRRHTRAVGEVLALPQPDLELPPLSGFENHAGSTALGSTVRALAVVQRGVGNGAADDRGRVLEGAVTPNVIATYLHGPVLARNPALADLLIARATGTTRQSLAPLIVPEHAALRRSLGVAG